MIILKKKQKHVCRFITRPKGSRLKIGILTGVFFLTTPRWGKLAIPSLLEDLHKANEEEGVGEKGSEWYQKNKNFTKRIPYLQRHTNNIDNSSKISESMYINTGYVFKYATMP